MPKRRPYGSLPRSAALIALGALAVHQLRYLLVYGSHAGAELAQQGHAYLFQAVPVLAGLALAALAARLIRAAVCATNGSRPLTARLSTRTALYALSMASVFVFQETVEGVLSAGHLGGFAAILGRGGWIALPLALVLGALAALLDGGLVALESALSTLAGTPPRPRAPRCAGSSRPTALPALAATPLAFGLARRPPPAA